MKFNIFVIFWCYPQNDMQEEWFNQTSNNMNISLEIFSEIYLEYKILSLNYETGGIPSWKKIIQKSSTDKIYSSPSLSKYIFLIPTAAHLYYLYP